MSQAKNREFAPYLVLLLGVHICFISYGIGHLVGNPWWWDWLAIPVIVLGHYFAVDCLLNQYFPLTVAAPQGEGQ